jgi:putative transposase
MGRKPKVLVDGGGPWYPWALERMGFRWEHVTFGKRNAIERLFGTVKRRTREFYNNINGRNAMGNLTTFLDLFMIWYNHLRKHQEIGRAPTEATLF